MVHRNLKIISAFVAGGTAATALMGAIVPGALWSSASALTCPQADYGVGGGVEDAYGTNFDTARGMSSDMWIPYGPTDCQRISSIYLQTQSGGYFEFGWVLGHSNCSGSSYSVPRLFYWAKREDNSPKQCAVLAGTLDSGQYDDFRVVHANNDLRFRSAWKGTVLQPVGVVMDFPVGYAQAVMERSWSTDNCTARWAHNEEMFVAGWSAWDDFTAADDDPGCSVTRESADTGKVTP